MPRKKQAKEDEKLDQEVQKIIFLESITPLEISGGLVVTREELNQVVAKLNEVIKKLN